MEQNALARVRELFRYAQPARTVAIVCGVVVGGLYVLLVLLGALFADLLVSRGRIPNFAQLPVAEQQAFLDEWKALPEEDRQLALKHLSFGDLETPPAKMDTQPWDVQARWKGYQTLLGGDAVEMPPVPGQMTPESLKQWATKRKIAGDPYFAAAVEHEYRWRAYVWLTLHQRVSTEAADHWQPKIEPGEAFQPPGLGEDNSRQFGLLSLVVRQRNTTTGRIVANVAAISGWTWHGENANRAYATGLFLVAIFVLFLRAVLLAVLNDAAGRAVLEVITRLRRSLYHHTARQGAMTISPEAVDEAGTLFTREVEQVHEALEFNLVHHWRNTITFVLLLGLALVTHVWLSVAFMLFAVLVWGLAGQLSGSFKRQRKHATRMAANRLELLLESLRLVRLVKSYLMELFNQSRVERQLADYAKAHLRRSRGDAIARPLLVAVGAGAGVTLLYLGGRVILHGGLSIAGLVVLVVSFLSLYYPLRCRLAYRRMLRHGREAAATLFEFLDRRGDVAAYPDAEFFPGVAKGIEFSDVSVKDPNSGRVLLRKINWKIKAGTRVGIVASEHDEQMALVALLPRFLDPGEGEIKIDGRPLKWLTPDSLRAQIGLVLQNNLIFNDTVANNIGCGDPSYTLPQIIEAAKVAHAHQFVQRLPYGYETTIGELGHSLSVGEMYRIALARAILRDPSIYIIEEPATQLDDDTKDLVDDALDRVLPGKTVVYLPHRVSTLRHCDQLYLLHEGAFVASGDHRELITENELYRHLYYLEFNPFAEKVVV